MQLPAFTWFRALQRLLSTRICVSGTNLLLLYADDHARLWDVKTLEFRRSAMDL